MAAHRGGDGANLPAGRIERRCEEMKDLIKAPVILMGYLIFAPLLGALIKSSRAAQRWVFALMVFMTSWHINKFTLMLDSIETYRGHTKGFEFSFIEILAVALIAASFLGRRGDRSWRWLAPGALLWLLYCGASWLSILAAPDKLYVVMSGVRFTKAVLIYLAAFHFIRDKDDLRLLLRAMAFTLVVQAAVVLKMKYVDHFYQVRGWFEHQNPLAMWAYMCGLPLLAAAMSQVNKRDTQWFTGGFIASAIIVQSSLSRAALVFFGAGAAAVVLLGLLDSPTAKRAKFIAGLGTVAALGLLLSLDTIVARFHDEGNEASGKTRDLMNLASKAMLAHSGIGIGWNNFALTINQPFPYGDVIDDDERARGHRVDADYAKGVVESHYWLLLAETGYGGFVTYMLFITVTAWWSLRGAWRWRGEMTGALLGGIFVALSLTYVHSNLERVLTQTKNYSMWLILLGMVARVETWRRSGGRA
jgi:hypothetical protein